MKKMVTLTAVLLLLAGTFLFAGGQKEEGTAADVSVPQKLVYVVNNEADDLDPGTSAETFADPAIINCFEGLVTTDENETPVPGVAESWTISPDGTVYTFKIRKNAAWSDGKALTAGDFDYSWKRVLDPAVGAKNAGMLYSFIKNGEKCYNGELPMDQAGIRVIDDYTIEVTLEAPTPYMLQMFAFRCFYPVRKDIVEADPEGWHRKAETYIGNGPFMVKEMNFGESIVLVKNEHYWDAGNVKLEEITFRTIGELSTALTAMESGDVDGIENVPAAEIPRLKAQSDEFYILPALGTTYYLYNNQRKPLDDVRVRKALSLALNRREIVDTVIQGAGIPAFAIVPLGLAIGGKDFREVGGYYGGTETANVEEARRLLAEAGYPDGKGFPDITLGYYTHPTVKQLVEAMQQMWKKNLNIDLKITNAEWQVYYADVMAMNYDIAAMGWGGDYAHPMTFMAIFTSESPNNLTNWGSAEYDGYIAAAQKETNGDKILEYLHKAEDLLMEEQRILNIYHRSYTMMMADHVKDWKRTVLGSIIFKNAYITE